MEDKRLNRIEEKLDTITDRLASIDVTLAKQSVILDEHVKRSNLLEAKLTPVERHVSMVSGAIKLIVLGSAIAGIIEIFK